MAKRIHLVPKCPNCGKRNSHVVLTTEAINGKFDIIRRRHCYSCDHRWYTGQVLEVAIEGIEWADRGKLVNYAWER